MTAAASGPRVTFGISCSGHPPDTQFAIARMAEERGFDSIWCGDHLSFHNPIYESLTLLASYASITKRIKLGSAVYLLALRTPAVAAKVTSTLDVLCGGRLIFGVGVGGENPKEFELVGVPHKERGARVTEGIDVVRTLWRDTPATFKGRFTSFENVSIDPKPVQKPGPPIWIGGRSDAALERAGRQGDGWVSYVIHADRYRQSVEKIRVAAESAGRPFDKIVMAHLTFIAVGRDGERARRQWIERVSKRYAQDFTPLADKFGVFGTPEQCAEQIERFRQAGCSYFIFSPSCPPEEEREQLEMMATEIVPHFAS